MQCMGVKGGDIVIYRVNKNEGERTKRESQFNAFFHVAQGVVAFCNLR